MSSLLNFRNFGCNLLVYISASLHQKPIPGDACVEHRRFFIQLLAQKLATTSCLLCHSFLILTSAALSHWFHGRLFFFVGVHWRLFYICSRVRCLWLQLLFSLHLVYGIVATVAPNDVACYLWTCKKVKSRGAHPLSHKAGRPSQALPCRSGRGCANPNGNSPKSR